MLLRNIIERAVIGIIALAGGMAYLYLKKRIEDVESSLLIRKKGEIKGKLEP